MNVPNAITLSRLVLTAACVALLALSGPDASPGRTMCWIAFWLFLVAAATDFVDGWIARRYGQVTPFGRVADPFVDKVLVCGVLIALLRFPIARAYVADWMVVLIVAREFLVTAVRGLAESQGVAFPADRLGKFKMIAQSCTAGALLTLLCGVEFWRPVAAIGIWVTLALTLWSGANYVWKARHLLRAS
ncbi:MAG: CDP-diacylglycerol--glycerol-3-phosphate 3-phosphatidyltransferase [Planctomycetota bacterium]